MHYADVLSSWVVHFIFTISDFKYPKLFEKSKRFRQQFLLIYCVQTIVVSLFAGFGIFLYFRGEIWQFGSNFYNFAREVLNLSDWMSAPFGIIAEFIFIANSCAANILNLHVNFLFIQTISTLVSYFTR